VPDLRRGFGKFAAFCADKRTAGKTQQRNQLLGHHPDNIEPHDAM
jgi:hypothetical protein